MFGGYHVNFALGLGQLPDGSMVCYF